MAVGKGDTVVHVNDSQRREGIVVEEVEQRDLADAGGGEPDVRRRFRVRWDAGGELPAQEGVFGEDELQAARGASAPQR
jgi:hypothetical protein